MLSASRPVSRVHPCISTMHPAETRTITRYIQTYAVNIPKYRHPHITGLDCPTLRVSQRHRIQCCRCCRCWCGCCRSWGWCCRSWGWYLASGSPDRYTSVPRPATTAGGGGQVQRTWQKHKSRASGWLAGALAGWLAGEPSQPSGDSLLVFLQSVFTHELRAGISISPRILVYNLVLVVYILNALWSTLSHLRARTHMISSDLSYLL